MVRKQIQVETYPPLHAISPRLSFALSSFLCMTVRLETTSDPHLLPLAGSQPPSAVASGKLRWPNTSTSSPPPPTPSSMASCCDLPRGSKCALGRKRKRGRPPAVRPRSSRAPAPRQSRARASSEAVPACRADRTRDGGAEDDKEGEAPPIAGSGLTSPFAAAMQTSAPWGKRASVRDASPQLPSRPPEALPRVGYTHMGLARHLPLKWASVTKSRVWNFSVRCLIHRNSSEARKNAA